MHQFIKYWRFYYCRKSGLMFGKRDSDKQRKRKQFTVWQAKESCRYVPFFTYWKDNGKIDLKTPSFIFQKKDASCFLSKM